MGYVFVTEGSLDVESIHSTSAALLVNSSGQITRYYLHSSIQQSFFHI